MWGMVARPPEIGSMMMRYTLPPKYHKWGWILLALIGLSLAFGRFNPLYLILAELPGFNLFRVPARWLSLFTLGMAMLAGIGAAEALEGAEDASAKLECVVDARQGNACKEEIDRDAHKLGFDQRDVRFWHRRYFRDVIALLQQGLEDLEKVFALDVLGSDAQRVDIRAGPMHTESVGAKCEDFAARGTRRVLR